MATLANYPLYPPKVLLWGDPGSGKTPFITSFGQGLQIIDTDNGLRSSLTLEDKFKSDRLKVDVVDCLERNPNKATAWDAVKKHILSVYDQTQKGTYPFECLALDTFTTLGDFCLRSILGASGKLNTATPLTQAQWGLGIMEVDNLFTFLKALPIPVVVSFHSRDGSPIAEDSPTMTKEIAIFGKNLPAKLTSYFDEVWRQRVRISGGRMDPFLQTMPDGIAKVVRSRGALKNETPTSLGLREIFKLIGWEAKKGGPGTH